MKQSILFSITILLILSSCGKENRPYIPITRCQNLTRNMDTISKYIHGTWKWQEEKRFNRHTGQFDYYPSKIWRSLSLRLSGDTAIYFENEIQDSLYQFRLQREFEITNQAQDSLPVLVFYSFTTGTRRTYVPILLCKDQLIMQYQYLSDLIGELLWFRNN